MSKPLSILVVKLSAIGDVIHALPVSYAIKETYPDSRLVWVVEPVARPLLEGNPCIDEIITFEKKKFKSLGGFLREFGPLKKKIKAAAGKPEGYDYALDLQGLFKSAAIVWASGAKKCYGIEYMREMSDKISTPVVGPHANGHIVERYLDVARAIGCRVDEVKFPVAISEKEEWSAGELLRRAGVKDGTPYAVLAVGANWPNKRWPTKKYAELSDRLFDAGVIPVFVGGGAADESSMAEINSYVNIPPVSLVNQTSLKELAAVIKGAAVALGGDTGPIHLAAAVETPAVMVMGPTAPDRSSPYGMDEDCLLAGHPCANCRKRACPKGIDCLDAISVDRVYDKLMEVIGRGR